jgi:hypothetical protein
MQRQYELFAASSLGSNHRDVGANNQDTYGVGSVDVLGDEYHFGLVLDGMSRDKKKKTRNHGWHSEAGALLTRYFALRKIHDLLLQSLPLSVIPGLLFESLNSFISTQIGTMGIVDPWTIAEFVREHWLFTTLGFIQGPQSTIVFSRGDGFVRVNGEVKTIDQNGTPYYLGYFTIPWSVPSEVVQNRFFEVWTFPTNEVKFLAVATDGWKASLSLLDTVANGMTSWELQLKMNVWSLDQAAFSDDATIAGIYLKG